MKSINKLFATLALFSVLFVAIPKQEAKAGLILSPVAIPSVIGAVGFILLIVGIWDHSPLLIILDDQSSANKINLELQNRYGNLTSNQSAFENLANMIAAKTQNLDFSNKEKVEVNFTKNEIVMALGPAAANTELLEAVSNDLM
jgi:hypothetical protein